MIVKMSFLLYTSFYNAIKNLDDISAGRLFKGIFEYHMFKKLPVGLSERGQGCFEMMQPIFDQNIDEYRKRSERNKKNIQKRWKKQADFTDVIGGNDTTGINGMYNDNVNDNGNDNDNGNENVNDNKNGKKKKEKKKKEKKEIPFIKPTIEEVRAYCEARQNGVDAEHFYNFYEAKDWMLVKNKIKNWKCCVHTCERRNKDVPPKQATDIDAWVEAL